MWQIKKIDMAWLAENSEWNIELGWEPFAVTSENTSFGTIQTYVYIRRQLPHNEALANLIKHTTP